MANSTGKFPPRLAASRHSALPQFGRHKTNVRSRVFRSRKPRRDSVSNRLIACIVISAALAFFNSEIWQIASDSAPMQWAASKLADIGENPSAGKQGSGLVARFPMSKTARNENSESADCCEAFSGLWAWLAPNLRGRRRHVLV